MPRFLAILFFSVAAFAGDPFAAYHASIDRTLAAITADPQPQARPAEPDPPPTHPRNRLAEILAEEGVPEWLAAVVQVESGGNPYALSPKQARGLWQLIPETARRYGLTVTPSRDQRIEVEPSTRAAARYLRDLYSRFGDWRLALAAYNAGEETVGSALARTGRSTFAAIARALPEETRRYVPAVLAAAARLD